MSLTRKEFFRQAALTLGKTAVEVSDTLKGLREPPPADLVEDNELPDFPGPQQPDPQQVACPDNGSCLARSCGCFSCIEKCEAEAISVLPGVGIGVDQARCTGCGACEYLCPVFPKAIRMQPRPQENAEVLQ